MTEQRICIRFCIKLEHSSQETIQVIQKAAAMGNWWLAASSQRTRSCITSHEEFFGEMLKHPGDSAPQKPRFGALWLLLFRKTKIAFERKQIPNHRWDSEKYDRTADGDPNIPTLKGTEALLSYVQCFLYLVSSSVNASIFHIIWLHGWVPSGQTSYLHVIAKNMINITWAFFFEK